MKISKGNVIRSFYYLMAVDGEIGNDELKQFTEFGHAFDEKFEEHKDTIVDECRKIVDWAQRDSDPLLFLVQSFENAVQLQNDSEETVSARLMLWDLYIMAFSNGLLLDKEKAFIKALSRFCQINESVVLEMEELCKTDSDIEKEQQWVKKSDLRYSEAEPILKEMENRRNTLHIAASNLIEDEMYSPDAAYVADVETGAAREFFDSYDKTVDKIGASFEETYNDFLGTETGKKVAEIGDQVGSAVQDTVNSFKESDVGKAAIEFGEQAGKTIQDASAQVASFFGNLFKK